MNIEKLREESVKYMYDLTEEKIKKLKLVNKGTDAKLYKLSTNLLLKLYYTDKKVVLNNNDDDVKTIKPTRFNNSTTFMSYCYDANGVRLGYDKIIEMAKRKQFEIKKTILPINPVYINHHFRGCIIKYHHNYYPISCFSFLPKRTKLKIIKDLLVKIKELLNNNIYPIDLYNKQNSNLPHNNIVINFSLNSQIVDLDGKSVAYTEKFNPEFYKKSLFELSTLLLEFLFDQELEDYYLEFDQYQEYYQQYFYERYNIPPKYIDNLLSNNIDLDVIEEFVDYELSLKK